MSDEDQYLPLKEILNLSLKPTGNDLIEIERRIKVLEEEKSRVEAQPSLRPGRNRQLDAISQSLQQLGWAKVVATEHVRADRFQSKVYENQKALQAEAEKAQKVQQPIAGAAPATSASPRGILQQYLAQWKAGKKAEPTSQREKDDGSEPDPTGGA
jgi:hypothetical protein